MSKPWHDKNTLEELYKEERLSTREIGDRLGCTGTTIGRWLRKHGIETRGDQSNRGGPWTDEEQFERMWDECDGVTAEMAREWDTTTQAVCYWMDKHGFEREESMEPWQDEEVLKRLYIEQERTLNEVGGILGCDNTTVAKWLKKHGIESHKPGNGDYHRKNVASRYMHKDGYMVSASYNPDESPDRVMIHRLLAVAEYGVDAVKGKDVHHISRIPWDNRPENLELMSKAEHGRLHWELLSD